MEYMINQLSENDISKYRERSVRALNGIRSLLETPSIISKNGTIVGKYLTIARYMGIPTKPGQASVYNYFTPINTDAIILIRFSDHNNTNAELYNLHEKNGRPNARYIICFSQGEIEPMNEFWNESQHVVIPYDVDAIDNEDSIAKLLNSLVTLLHDGETTFPTLPYFQNSEHVPAQDVLAQVNKDLEKITTENTDRKMSKKNTIKLTESKLKEIIAESVKDALNEISYSTVKSAYNKMQAKGQPKRAEKLSRTFSDIYNDDDVQYDVANDKLTLQKDATLYNQHQDKRHAFYMGNDRGYERDTVKWGGGANLPDSTDNHHITTNPAKARKYATAIKNYNPNTKLTRDDFRK